MKPAEEYILNRQEPFRSILIHVQLIIEHTVPEAELLYKWSIPCYYLSKSPLCYLNQTKDYVDIGFWHSAYLQEFEHLMVSENRKIVKSLRYYSMEDINDELLVSILKEVKKHKGKSFYKP